MLDFEFLSPTKILFGKGTVRKAGREVRRLTAGKVLFHYGRESLKKSGLYDVIITSLAEQGIDFIEYAGSQPNPRLGFVREGIRICREQEISLILAAGGGSAIDTAKAMGMGAVYEGDVWDFYIGRAEPVKSIPTGVILTIPAAGSEASKSSVITNEANGLKRGANFDVTRPLFAIMDPEVTYTLPPYQTACGLSDILSHVLERYFTHTPGVDLTDRLCEGTMRAVIDCARKVLVNPRDYDARANIMWAGALAHNDLLGTGRQIDFASHAIEHELSSFNDVAHGAGLAVVFPAWMRHVLPMDPARFAQWAGRVFDVPETGDKQADGLEGIRRFRNFLREIGMPLTLGEIGIRCEDIPALAGKCKRNADGTIGNFARLTKRDIREILALAL